jgi:transcriptional regulator with XRE-family HTH domain
VSPDEIKRRLQDRNLAAVAEALGLSPHTLYRMMRGAVRPHRSTLKRLEQYLANPPQVQDGANP